jgi:hypothetical protein
MAPYTPWNVRNKRKGLSRAEIHRIRPYANHGGPHNGVITFRRIGLSLGMTIREARYSFTQALEVLGEYEAARQYTKDLPVPLWFPRNRSVECLPEFQAQGRLHDA